ncbi:hypothetical protein A3C23_00730 [Candidatus Roizmanbacteria bacterium RIFCSPHIGHO2_02_FULL_37_13b]|uniref:Glycosyltransferase RgtA/B/C/D-like domain-containing protein n=1 Tax=Candidatus Roizmanbacteria bacterium RIFCSPLOWO2_02_FULL_36_11 TaxID=1802071 RepID=A0A1F7JD28_9BACT|nr:MAG: hypothetical protein A3C23_00730 [Candidatus Roizmanbacteria bacterium RIFCSPHIGHO2_02_FULL_37_13b]OGK53522.1 MAG: hypothetical protein A3H78_04840 [Candidatus Roizmanbacteria bacterium RIFCSPLOWO2_02_FULL_36_11]
MNVFIRRNALVLVFLIVLIGLLFVTYKDYGISWDEQYYIDFGKHYVIQFFDFFQIKHNLIDDSKRLGPLFQIHLKGHGVLLDIITIIILFLLRNSSFETIHLIKALLSVPIFLVVFIISSHLLGRRMGFYSLFILLLSPRFFGDIFDNTVDVRAALFFGLALSFIIYYIKSNQNIYKTIILSLLLALAANERIIFIYLYLLTFFILIYLDVKLKKVLNHILIKKQLVLLIFFLLFLHLFHPYLWSHPILGLFEFFISASNFQFQESVLFEGKNIIASILPWYYLIKMMLITIPLSTLFLAGTGIIKIYFIIKNHRKTLINRLNYLIIFASFFIPLLLQIVIRPIIYDGWRQFLFLTIPLIIFASVGLNSILKLKHSVLRIIISVFITINYLSVMKQMIILHPYQYIYYNELIGGLPGAFGKFETDYWCKSYKEAVVWFNSNINEEKKLYDIKVEGNSLSASHYFKKNMSLVSKTEEADYIITFTRWQRDKQYHGQIIKTIKRDGVPLVFIIKT